MRACAQRGQNAPFNCTQCQKECARGTRALRFLKPSQISGAMFQTSAI